MVKKISHMFQYTTYIYKQGDWTIYIYIVSKMKIRLELEIVREPIKGLQKLCIICGLCM